MKTSDLIGPALDWSVAKCEGKENTWGKSSMIPYDYFTGHRYSTDWAQGGPIIAREQLYVNPTGNADKWKSYRYLDIDGGGFSREYYGPTPLISAMRCYVASKLGDEVDVPEELR
jgi:hypothetical protein